MDDIKKHLKEAEAEMDAAVKHTITAFAKIRAGKATPALVDGLLVSYYGSPTPMGQVASVTVPDPHTISIKPWEKSTIPEIVKSVRDSDLQLNPIAEADLVRINIPPLSGDRRKDLVKMAKNEAEDGKISIRNARKEANNALRNLQKEGVAEDLIKRAEDDVQKLTDAYSKKIDELFAVKEKEITTV
ncbi:MAG: ribosome recycling factor [Bernardetiaceae bacterium]|nr:ribosome recycling factor [Bernardetiaceae bacterium]